MTPDAHRCTALFLFAGLAQAAGLAEMFLRLHPEQEGIAQDYLAAVARMHGYAESAKGRDWRDVPLFAEVSK